MSNSLEKLTSLVNDVKFTMLTTMSTDGNHRSRPMTTIGIKNIDEGIWFIGAKDSDVVADISANRNVCLAYAEPSDNQYASITGVATLVDDANKLDELWSDMYNAFFDGKNDPNIQLIQVKPVQGEYWKGDGDIISFLKMGKAALTGEKVDNLGENVQFVF